MWGKSQPDQGHIDRSIALSSMRDEDPQGGADEICRSGSARTDIYRCLEETRLVTLYANAEDEGGGGGGGGGGEAVKRGKFCWFCTIVFTIYHAYMGFMSKIILTLFYTSTYSCLSRS